LWKRVDLRPAAVHHDGVDADVLEQRDILQYGLGDVILQHGVSAVLDHHRLPAEDLYIGQGLQKDVRVMDERIHLHFYRSFIRC